MMSSVQQNKDLTNIYFAVPGYDYIQLQLLFTGATRIKDVNTILKVTKAVGVQ